MRLYISVVLLFLLSACDKIEDADAAPGLVQVERIEIWLEKQKCIGKLSGWERRYQFDQDLNIRSSSFMNVSSNIIVSRLLHGDATYPIRPGRQVLPTKLGFIGEIDDRPGYMADGKFDVTSGKMILESCGYSRGG